MKIVLLNDVASLGRRFEVKNVTAGYARNYLLPKGLAALADNATLKRIELLKHKHESDLKRRRDEAVQLISQLAGTIITIEVKTNEQGHLFEGIDRTAIAEAVKRETKIELDPDWIELERPIKVIGDYDLTVAHGETKEQIKVRIVSV